MAPLLRRHLSKSTRRGSWTNLHHPHTVSAPRTSEPAPVVMGTGDNRAACSCHKISPPTPAAPKAAIAVAAAMVWSRSKRFLALVASRSTMALLYALPSRARLAVVPE